jgi:hypothetical protein
MKVQKNNSEVICMPVVTVTTTLTNNLACTECKMVLERMQFLRVTDVRIPVVEGL